MPEPAVIALEAELDLRGLRTLVPQLSEVAGAHYEHLILDCRT
jgi:hypothetical protein